MSTKSHTISFIIDEFIDSDYDTNLVAFKDFYLLDTTDQIAILDSIARNIELHKSLINN